jgi:acyl-CoA synthetase (AMP-forming)/AMP-acid ligase II
MKTRFAISIALLALFIAGCIPIGGEPSSEAETSSTSSDTTTSSSWHSTDICYEVSNWLGTYPTYTEQDLKLLSGQVPYIPYGTQVMLNNNTYYPDSSYQVIWYSAPDVNRQTNNYVILRVNTSDIAPCTGE